MARREDWDDQLERNPYRDLDERAHHVERAGPDDRDDERRPGIITRFLAAIGAFIENILSLGHSRSHSPNFTRKVTNITTVRHFDKSGAPFGDEANWSRDASGRRTFRVNSFDELPPEIRRLAEEALRETGEQEVGQRFEYESRETEGSPHDYDPDAVVTLGDSFPDESSPSFSSGDVHRSSRSVRREVRIVNGRRTERIIITGDDGRERTYDSIDEVPDADRRWLVMIEGLSRDGDHADADDFDAFDDFDAAARG